MAPEEEGDLDHGPYVCPSCQAVGGARCASWCIGAEIERRHEQDAEDYDDDPTSEDDDEDGT